MESEQATPVVSVKDVVQSSVKVPEFGKHLKKAGGYIGRNVVEITIKMKTIVRKTLGCFFCTFFPPEFDIRHKQCQMCIL